MTWTKLIKADAFPECGVLEAELEGNDLLVWRLQSHEYAAIAAHCPHMRSYMPNGLAADTKLSALLSGDDIVCPFHGWHFDNKGRCTNIPPGQAIPKKVERGEAITRAWRLRECKGWIEIQG